MMNNCVNESHRQLFVDQKNINNLVGEILTSIMILRQFKSQNEGLVSDKPPIVYMIL